MMPYELGGKRILIAGASSGIGRAAALRMAAAGATVAVTARRADRLEALVREIEGTGGRAFAFAADLQDTAQSKAAVDQAAAAMGGIDMVLLNAGGAPAIDMRRMNAADVTHYMRSNYDVVVNALFPVLDHMRSDSGGVVVHTNSLAGLIPVPLQGPYCAAKAATKLLIDTCRLEFAEFGIRFVTVYPGFIATEATQGDGMPARGEISEDRAIDHILAAIRKLQPHTLFPARTACQVRLLMTMPEWMRNHILAKTLPNLED